jgi:hypothetical protein
MPTRRKRHSITETDDVAAVLDRVRGATGGEVDLPELVKLGGEVKLRQLSEARAQDERRLQLRRRFAERTLVGEGIDIDALHEVRERGWARG